MYGKLSTRRFACDRCRTYKLRCERNPISGRSAGCERCIKANLLCKTTSEAGPIPVPKDLGASSCRVEPPQRRRATISTDRWVHDRPVSALASCPPSPRDPPVSQTAVVERSSSLLPRAASRHVEREDLREQVAANPLYILGTGTIAEESQASADLSGTAHCSLGDSDSIHLDESNQQDALASMDFMMVDFGCHDGTELRTPSTEQHNHIGQSSSDSLGMLDSNSSKGELEEAQSPFRDAMGFCADLVESCQSFTPDDSPPAYDMSAKLAEQSIQNALDKTSRFLEILECLVAAEASPCRRCFTHQSATGSPSAVTGSHQQRQATEAFSSGRPSSNSSNRCHSASDSGDRSVSCASVKHEAYDVVLITTLVTSYVYLVRVWRYVVTLIHQLLLATGPSELRGLLLLPSLQLGGFRLINNPSIQIQVLFELRSDMFQRIELMLGVGQDGAEGRYAEGKEKGRQVINISPFAASIRETLLYQEKMRTAAKHGMGDFSLKDITSKVKMQLEAQGV